MEERAIDTKPVYMVWWAEDIAELGIDFTGEPWLQLNLVERLLEKLKKLKVEK